MISITNNQVVTVVKRVRLTDKTGFSISMYMYIVMYICIGQHFQLSTLLLILNFVVVPCDLTKVSYSAIRAETTIVKFDISLVNPKLTKGN